MSESLPDHFKRGFRYEVRMTVFDVRRWVALRVDRASKRVSDWLWP